MLNDADGDKNHEILKIKFVALYTSRNSEIYF